MLWLVEGANEGAAERIRGMDGGRWRRSARDGACSRLERVDGSRLTVVHGRQCATEEGLEVLVVGTLESVPDGRRLLDVVADWIDRPVLVMLPWGFGKWSGRRGRLVSQAYDAYAERGLRLADTAARPSWMPTPRRLRRAADEGRLVSAGSDPFPFPDCIDAVGRYGFRGPDLDADAPWPSMLEALREMEPGPAERFGRRMDTIEFAVLQTRMQLRKQLNRKA